MATIREMTRTASGTYDLGPDMAADLDLLDASAMEVYYSLSERGPDEDWREAEGFAGYGLVLCSLSGRLLSVECLTPTQWRARVAAATGLDELRETLIAAEESLGEDEKLDDLIDLTDLPSWGPAPDDTDEVASWDGSRLLVQLDGWRLVDREDVAEAVTTCVEIGRDLRDQGRDLAGISRYLPAYTHWVDASRRLGSAAHDHVALGWRERDDELSLAEAVEHVLTAPADEVIAMLDGTQARRAERIGVTQGVVSDWAGGRTEMSRLARHQVLALLGYQVDEYGRWARVR